MVGNARENALAAWFDEAEDSMLSSLVRGLRRDRAAVAAVVRAPSRTGKPKGSISCLSARIHPFEDILI